MRQVAAGSPGFFPRRDKLDSLQARFRQLRGTVTLATVESCARMDGRTDNLLVLVLRLDRRDRHLVCGSLSCGGSQSGEVSFLLRLDRGDPVHSCRAIARRPVSTPAFPTSNRRSRRTSADHVRRPLTRQPSRDSRATPDRTKAAAEPLLRLPPSPGDGSHDSARSVRTSSGR